MEVPFTDAETDWYAVPAAWAKGTGVASGYADGSFGGRFYRSTNFSKMPEEIVVFYKKG